MSAVAGAHRVIEEKVDALWETLQNRFVLYGEWALLTHSIYYDALPAYFLEVDVYDRARGAFLSSPGSSLDLHTNQLVCIYGWLG